MKNKIEFSRPVKINHVERSGYKKTIEANAEERDNLAIRFEAKEITSLIANVKISKQSDGLTYHVTGDVKASVIQESVISRTDVAYDIATDIEAYYIDNAKITSFAEEKMKRNMSDSNLDDDEAAIITEQDDPEPIVNGAIDIGETAAQFFGLAVDSYPRAMDESDGSGDYIEVTEEEIKEQSNPFSVLSSLKDKK